MVNRRSLLFVVPVLLLGGCDLLFGEPVIDTSSLDSFEKSYARTVEALRDENPGAARSLEQSRQEVLALQSLDLKGMDFSGDLPELRFAPLADRASQEIYNAFGAQLEGLDGYGLSRTFEAQKDRYVQTIKDKVDEAIAEVETDLRGMTKARGELARYAENLFIEKARVTNVAEGAVFSGVAVNGAPRALTGVQLSFSDDQQDAHEVFLSFDGALEVGDRREFSYTLFGYSGGDGRVEVAVQSVTLPSSAEISTAEADEALALLLQRQASLVEWRDNLPEALSEALNRL